MWPADGQLPGIAQSTESIPDCKRGRSCFSPTSRRRLTPVLDTGGFYPHHNLYYVVSDKWDLEVLGGLLLSDIANLFVGAYCVKMRGGTYRFQAQYLRKIRVPAPDAVDARNRVRPLSGIQRQRPRRSHRRSRGALRNQQV